VRRAYLDETSAREQLAAADAQLAAASQAVTMAQERYQA
jgi:outer membrane protein TolC